MLLGACSSACATLPPPSLTPGPDATALEHVPVRGFEDDRCGPGSLAVVLNALGDPVSEDELAAAIPRTERGRVLSVDLMLAARERGLFADLVTGSAEALREEIGGGRPAILMLRLLDVPGRRRDIFHYVVVDGMDPGRDLFRFQFGDGKTRWAGLGQLERAWKGSGHALLRVRAPEAFAQMRAAMHLEAAGRPHEAAESYQAIVRAHPRLVRGWVNLGNAESAAGRDAEAERAYRRALDVAPDDVDALNNLAWLLFVGGRGLDEAESLARRAASGAGAERPRVLDTLARILGARGRCDEAEETFAEAQALEALSPARRDEVEIARGEVARSCAESRDREDVAPSEGAREGPRGAGARPRPRG